MTGTELQVQGSLNRHRAPSPRPAAGLMIPALILAVGCHGGGSTFQRTQHPDLDAESVDAFLAAVGDGRYGDLHSTLITRRPGRGEAAAQPARRAR